MDEMDMTHPYGISAERFVMRDGSEFVIVPYTTVCGDDYALFKADAPHGSEPITEGSYQRCLAWLNDCSQPWNWEDEAEEARAA